jgi:hypothetical protein
MKIKSCTPLAFAAFACACNSGQENAASANTVTTPVTPGALSAYVGKHPDDPVNGVAFLDHRLVRAAAERLENLAHLNLPELVRIWSLAHPAPSEPIIWRGSRLIAFGRDADGDPDWWIAVRVDGSDAEFCFHRRPPAPGTRRYHENDGENEWTGDCTIYSLGP